MAVCSSAGVASASWTSMMPFSGPSPSPSPSPACTAVRAAAPCRHSRMLPKIAEAAAPTIAKKATTAATPTFLAAAGGSPQMQSPAAARLKLLCPAPPQAAAAAAASKSLRVNHSCWVSQWQQKQQHPHYAGAGAGEKGEKKRLLLLVQCALVANSPSSWIPPSAFASAAVSAEEQETDSQPEKQPLSSKLVLVAGATGGVGQLVVATLLEKGVSVRALVRNAEKAQSLFGDKLGDQFELRVGDLRQPEVLHPLVFEGVTHVINAIGTSAFPSKRWFGENGTKNTDWIGMRNLVNALPKTLQRVVLVSSIGVTKPDQIPFRFLNLFGTLKYKKMGEDYLKSSGIPFTIIRPGRLTDGPYTSYDLNTLLKATAGTRRDVILGQGDVLTGEASRVVVAEACVQALDLKFTEGQIYELNSVEGDGPGKDAEKWASLFQAV